jgi:hypothetical protein
VEGLISLCPPKTLWNFKIAALFFARYKPFSPRPYQAVVGALTNGHLGHVCAVEHRLQKLGGFRGLNPILFGGNHIGAVPSAPGPDQEQWTILLGLSADS